VAWQLSALVSLHWRCWDDEFVVFDAGSGQTHQLSPITAASLMMLELASADINELTSRVSDELTLANDDQLSSIVNEAVHGLQVAGLIEFAS
jgi:PqqD family protein of HPr-rel-A system